MAKKIEWSKEAITSYYNVIDYLLKEWSEKEAENFIELTNKILRLISENPKIFKELKLKNFHEAVITKHNLIIYESNSDFIHIHAIWDTRRNPQKRKLR